MVIADEFSCNDSMYNNLKNKMAYQLTAEDSAYIQAYSKRCLAYAAKGKEPQQSCYPPCRAGFICFKGEYVSECNPPCPSGTICKGNDCIPVDNQMKINSPLKNPYERKGFKIGIWGAIHVVGIGLASAGDSEETKSVGAIMAIFAIPFVIGGIVETVRYTNWEQEHMRTQN